MKRTLKKNTEYQLQKTVCKYLDLNNILYCGSMGGQYQVFRSQRIKAKQTGYKRGFPDLFIYESRGGFHGLAIELKVGYNKPTKEQLDWIGRLTNNGYLATVCRNLDETLDIIKAYLKQKK